MLDSGHLRRYNLNYATLTSRKQRVTPIVFTSLRQRCVKTAVKTRNNPLALLHLAQRYCHSLRAHSQRVMSLLHPNILVWGALSQRLPVCRPCDNPPADGRHWHTHNLLMQYLSPRHNQGCRQRCRTLLTKSADMRTKTEGGRLPHALIQSRHSTNRRRRQTPSSRSSIEDLLPRSSVSLPPGNHIVKQGDLLLRRAGNSRICSNIHTVSCPARMRCTKS